MAQYLFPAIEEPARRIPYFPAEVITNILEFYVTTRRPDTTALDLLVSDDPNVRVGMRDHPSNRDQAFVALKQSQAELSAFMLVSKTWYYAAKPVVYRYPVIASPEALESFSQTVSERSDLVYGVRSLHCVPFSTTYGQPPRKSFPHIQARANMRLDHGSYAALLRTLQHCTRIDTLTLRFVDLSSILTLAHFLNPHPTSSTLRSLSLCGSCFDQRFRRRLELGRIMTPHLRVPQLEELWLENFFVSPRYAFGWPALPALRKLSIVRTWHTKPDAHILPPDLPKLTDLTLGIAGPCPRRVLTYIGHYARQLERLHIVGSSIWKETRATFAPMPKLRVLVLEATACGFNPPGVLGLPMGLEVLSVERRAAMQMPGAEWVELLHRTMHGAKVPALKRVRLAGLPVEGCMFTRCLELGCYASSTGRKFELDTSGEFLPHSFVAFGMLMVFLDMLSEGHAPSGWYWF